MAMVGAALAVLVSLGSLEGVVLPTRITANRGSPGYGLGIEINRHSARGGTTDAPPRAPRPAFDTSGLVGAEYTPWRAGNELWWANYSDYRDDVKREVQAMRAAFGFTAVRVFLHNMVFDASRDSLLSNMNDFLSILDAAEMRAGFVFFDDCWAHTGANLSTSCVPRQGMHNGCWLACPQDVQRNSINRFESYVSVIVDRFATDKRVAWWEIFNEPQRTSYSLGLRDAAFRWAQSANPIAPIISCWDDNNNTQIVDRHQYSAPWSLGQGQGVFANPAKGGIVTEAGCRWFQQDKDHGSPMTVVNWLDAIRKGGPAVAPFTPGVMLSWEVMVGHSMTRWSWLSKEGDPEPAIPWCGSMYPDGTPVSYTEAAALRRYLGRPDDFLYLETWLAPTVNAAESYFTLTAESTWHGWSPSKILPSGALYEMTVWASSGDGVLQVTAGGYNVSLSVTAEPRYCTTGGYVGCFTEGKRPGFALPSFPQNNFKGSMTNELCASLCKDAKFLPYANSGTERGGRYCMCGVIDSERWPRLDDARCSVPCGGNKTEKCGGEPEPGGTGDAISVYNVTCSGAHPAPQIVVSSASTNGARLATKSVADRMIGEGWNMLRILAEPNRVRVWLNPNFVDVTGASVPPHDLARPPQAPAPLVDVTGTRDESATGLSATARGGAWAIDYASVLPPHLF